MENKLKEALADLDKRIQQAVGQVTINNIVKKTSISANCYSEITAMQSEIDDVIDELSNRKNELHYIVNALLDQEVTLKTCDRQFYKGDASKRGEYGDSDDDFDFLNWGDDEDDKSDSKKDAKKYEGDGDDQEF